MGKLQEKYDLTGKKIGEWTVIKRAPSPEGKSNKNSYWECQCSCGNIRILSRDNLMRNVSKVSCGCVIKPRKKYVRTKEKAPKSIKRFRNIWNGMKRRCYDEKEDYYYVYGGRGIYVCGRWHDFKNFKEDMYESYLEFECINGENTASIDRLDNDKPYELSNCKWSTQLEQARNRSNNVKVEIEGKIYNTLSEVSETFNINYGTILLRYKNGKRGLNLVDRTKITSTKRVGTHYENRKHYEKMKNRREQKNQKDLS